MEKNKIIDDQVLFRDELYNLEATPDEIEYATDNIRWVMARLAVEAKDE